MRTAITRPTTLRRPLRLAALVAMAAAASGCVTHTGAMVVTPWGAAGLHRFDAGIERPALAREAALPTLERPLLSAPALASSR